MALAARSFNWRLNPDGTVDGHYPLGDKTPDVGTAAWDNVALQSGLGAAIAQRTTGTPFAHDVRQYVTGTAAATATLSVATVSGDDVTAEGWVFGGDDLEHSGSVTGSGFLHLGATVSGNTVYCDPISWSWIAAAPTDALAPTVPRKLIGTPANDSIVWGWDHSTDAHDGTNLGSGVKEYDLEINGAVTVVSALSPGLTSAYTLYTIGSPSPAPSAVQSGADWDITAEGMFNLAGGADRGCLLGRQVSGDFTVACYVPAFTGSSSGPRAGIQIREDVAAVGSRFLSAQLRVLDTGSRINVRYRSAVDGSATTAADITGITAAHIRVQREGDTFTVEYSLDNETWTPAASVNLALSATLTAGWDVTSQVNGVAKTCTIQQCALSTAAQASYTQSTVTASTARARARDLATPANVSAYGPLSDSVTPIVTAIAVKWHPGYYLLQTSPSSYSAAHISEIAAISNIKGWLQYVNWNTIETARGVYSWSFVDTLLQLCKDNGKRLCIAILDRNFSGGNPLPAYLSSESGAGGGWYVKANGQFQGKIYLQAVMDRLIALLAQIGARYDSDASFEGVICPSESSFHEITAQTDYSESAYIAQYVRLVTQAPLAFPHTNFWAGLNYGFSPANMPTITAAMAANRCGACGPDTATGNSDSSTNGDRAMRGLVWSGSAWVSGGTDMRGAIPIAHEWEGPELGGKERGWTMTQLYNHSFDTNRDNHSFILRKTFRASPNPPDDLYWDNAQSYAVSPRGDSDDIKTWMTAGGNPTRTTAPTVYDAVDTG